MSKNSFGARATLAVNGSDYTIHKLEALEKRGFALALLPYSIRVMIEYHPAYAEITETLFSNSIFANLPS